MSFPSEIKNLYKKVGFLDKYGGSVIITIFIISIFLMIFTYYYVLSLVNQAKPNWLEQKCNPEYMAMAGFGSPDAEGTNFDYSGKNFYECVQSILKETTTTATAPIRYATKGVMKVQLSNLTAIRGVRHQVNYIRNNMTKTVKNIMTRLVGFLIPTQNIILKIRDTFQKATGVLAAATFQMFGFLTIMKSMMAYIITTVITFLIALAASTTMQFAVPFNWQMAQLGLQFFLLLAIPAGIVAHWLEKTFNVSVYPLTIPPNPKCFDKNTIIETTTGLKKIKDIKNGNKLLDGGIVTAIMKLSRGEEKVYNFHDIIVTGTHFVYHVDKGWIMISEHEDSVEIDNYKEPIVYCINTNTKRIIIKDSVFLDWDDTNNKDFKDLKEKTGIKSKNDIHKFLDGGFVGNTKIEMVEGNKKLIKDIKVGDVLKFGEKVLGIVEIDGSNVDYIKKYKFQGQDIICGPNLQLVNKNLGNISTNCIIGETVNLHIKLYHLITDTKYLHIGDHKFLDYNGSMEVFDDEEQLLHIV